MVEYFSHLYEIARSLNKEYSLPSALRIALEKTVELLHLETGWIWLVQEDNKSVYLAASYNLPPALSHYPERLSGRCYCIDTYLTNGFPKAINISEIACTRLGNLKSGTRGLKFHATIPVSIEGKKVGLINIVSKESHQLKDDQLSVLNTISELVSIAIQRTRLYQSCDERHIKRSNPFYEVINKVITPGMEEIINNLEQAVYFSNQGNVSQSVSQIKTSLEQAKELLQQVSLIHSEAENKAAFKTDFSSLHYPTSPLTKRELEVLALVRKGFINKQIAGQLFISERTVKFHISSILSKLLAKTRTEAVSTAIQRGLLKM
jgi:DNA-binding NarL/FixJ family response regulator